MVSSLRGDVRRRIRMGELRRNLGSTYEAKQESLVGAVAGRNLISIGGQTYDAALDDVPVGSRVEVVNIGRPGHAVYASKSGGGVVLGGGGSPGGGGGGGSAGIHALDGPSHTGQLRWLQLNKAGSNLSEIQTRPHSALTGIGPNDHHARDHLITGSTHSITGSAFDLVGATGTNALGLLTPSSNPGAAAKILRTDSNGSIAFDTNLLYADAVNNRVGINRTPGGAALDVLAAANADHTLRVKQKSGQTGRLWRVENTAGDELIVLDSQGNLQSGRPGFVSGLTGWQITPTGNAEFNNIWARGELHASVFVKDEIHATGGTMLIATAGKVYADAEIDSETVDTEVFEFETSEGRMTWQVETSLGTSDLEMVGVFNHVEVEDPPSGAGFYFTRGDFVRVKTGVATGITDFWLEVINGQQFEGYSRYSVIKRSGTDGTLPAGAALVSYGHEGDGRVLLTSDLNYAPYIDVFTIGSSTPWLNDVGDIIPHVRLGQLKGVGVTAVSGIDQYGLIAGTDLSNANSPYIVASNLQLRLHKVDLTLNDGTSDTGEWDSSGNLTIGSNIGVPEGVTFQVVTTGAGAGDMIAGQLASNYIQWDHSESTLLIQGSFRLGGDVSNSLTVGENGQISSSNMTAYDQLATLTESGFWLGWDGTSHHFFVGSAIGNSFRLDEDDVALELLDGIDIKSYGDTVFYLRDAFGVPTRVMFDGTDLSYPDGNFSAGRLISDGDTIRIATSKTPASVGATGTTGDVAWSSTHIYVCIATDTWRRAALSTW